MHDVFYLAAPTPAGTDTLIRWLSLHGLPIVLLIVAALISTRFIQWATARITGRIDQGFQESDELVRSESAKHRHSVAQVISWVAIVIVYLIVVFNIIKLLNVPITGFVAPATVLGAALGFGAQRIVQDLLSGFFIITEKQYGFGDVVELTIVGSTATAEGTVEDVTLRITKIRSANGEMITVPNGQIVKATNLSKDWARSVVDIPLPTGADLSRVNEILRTVGEQTFADPRMRPLLLDEPTSMGVTEMEIDAVTVRIVARTLPGKQFEVSRDLRARIVRSFGRAGISLAPGETIQTGAMGAPVESEASS